MKTMTRCRASVLAALALVAHSSPVKAEQEFTDLVSKVMPSVVNIAILGKGQRVKIDQSGGD